MKLRFAPALLAIVSAPAFAAETCALDSRGAPSAALTYPGVVRGPASPQEVATQTAIAVARAHAPLSPKYAALPRVFVIYEAAGMRHGTIASVIDGKAPAPGEAVIVASRRRDPDAPCAFIPWTVRRKPAGPAV